MYIDRFINNKYIALLRYCININKDNSIIVDLKYGERNKTLLLRKLGKKLNFNAIYLRKFLLKFRESNKIISNTKISICLYKTKLKKKLRLFYIKFRKYSKKWLSKVKVPKNYIKVVYKAVYKYKQLKETKLIKFLKNKLIKYKIKKYRRLQKKIWFYNFINANTNLHKRFRKIKLLRFIVHRLLHNQVKGNVLLLDGFLGLNLHPLFFRRFKKHFLIYIRNAKKNFNFNKFNLNFISKLYPKIFKIGNLTLYLSGLKNVNRLLNFLYLNVAQKLVNWLTLDFDYKYLNKFRNLMSNLSNVNYIKVSFQLRAKKKGWRKTRRYLRKFKKMNFLGFFNLMFAKLVAYVFFYWLNNLIILFNIKSKVNILSVWYKPICFAFKQYIWRKKPRHCYVQYNEVNNLIFFNYKNRLLNLS